MALQGAAPYREIFVHGFTVDEEGRKMSKSLGNVVSPKSITEGPAFPGKDSPEPPKKKNKKIKQQDKKSLVYGVDTLRLWVSAHASNRASVVVSPSTFDGAKQDLDRVRAVFRFMLGNLNDSDELVSDPFDLAPLDRLALHRAAVFHEDACAAYARLQPNAVALRTAGYVANDLSAEYFALIRDR